MCRLVKTRPQPDFIDEFVPVASNQTLLLLHGTVSDKRDLIRLGKRAGLSSVRIWSGARTNNHSDV